MKLFDSNWTRYFNAVEMLPENYEWHIRPSEYKDGNSLYRIITDATDKPIFCRSYSHAISIVDSYFKKGHRASIRPVYVLVREHGWYDPYFNPVLPNLTTELCMNSNIEILAWFNSLNEARDFLREFAFRLGVRYDSHSLRCFVDEQTIYAIERRI